VSEEFFPGGASRGFSQKFFQGVQKVVEFSFYPSKLKKQRFFANNFKIRQNSPLPTPIFGYIHFHAEPCWRPRKYRLAVNLITCT